MSNASRGQTGTLDELADAYCARSTVGFTRNPPVGGSANSFGSGTLVRFGRVAGILTCAHVVEAVLTQEEIGLIGNGAREGQRQGIKVDCRALRRLVVRGSGPVEEGPDLGFIELPSTTMSALEALGSTIDLAGQRMRYNEPLTSPQFMEAFAGVPDEWMGLPEERVASIELEVTTMLIGGEIRLLSSSEGYDRVLFVPGPIPQPLKSYEGMSGGGIWRLGLREGGVAGFTVEDRRLIGVAFYQTEERAIVGHGSESIYERLLPQIAQWK